MMERTTAAAALRWAAVGYLLIYFNFDLTLGALVLPLLPNFVGWLLLYRAIQGLRTVQPALNLLAPFVKALGVWSLGQFVPRLAQIAQPYLGWASLVMALVALYFHFQFLTDIAGIAEELGAAPRAGEMLWYRTCITLATTATQLMMLLPERWQPAAFLPLLLNVVASVAVNVGLFRLAGQVERSLLN